MLRDRHLLIRVYGIVQGVGFRPFVNRIALKNDISGSVCNKGPYVEIYAQSTEDRIEQFLLDLRELAPERSVILRVKTWEQELTDEYGGKFHIIHSAKEHGLVFVSPDIATCPDCSREMYDPSNRRYLHPFINCTACGPRLTILDSMPYDRERTSMGEFPMCPDCEEEYTSMDDRRYHAQPVCCNDCGPELYLLDRDERGYDALIEARQIIRSGGIIAVKGIGGYHLCCDATNESAVARLRELKKRPVKPFAVMMKDMSIVHRECVVLPGEEEILEGPQKPIILLGKKTDGSRLAPSIAPGNPNVGVMIPYAPVQMLLFDYPDDPNGNEMTDCFVMTSGNPKGAPICMNDEEARKYLAPMCDAILSNNRKIRLRADDSVMSFYRNKPYMIRRSRGYAPLPVITSEEVHHSVIGIGGELKNTFCLAREDMYYPSAYIGDMADLRSVKALEAATERMMRLLEIEPEVIACDLHPKYNTSEVARIMADKLGTPLIEVQHHYAHIASCMAENEFRDKVIGVSFDGTGYGEDGSIWGGEILVCDLNECERAGSVQSFTHAGGDLASREGFRIAASILLEHPELIESLDLCDSMTMNSIRFMVGNGVNAVKSTSAGRLFDAVSAILGIRKVNTFEGDASMALQFAAERATGSLKYEGRLVSEEDGFVSLLTNELVIDIARKRAAGGDAIELAWMFHDALANMIVETCEIISRRTGIRTTALSGGVFQNLLLLYMVDERLENREYTVLKHSLIPANDGGIALGQAAIAMNRMKEDSPCV